MSDFSSSRAETGNAVDTTATSVRGQAARTPPMSNSHFLEAGEASSVQCCGNKFSGILWSMWEN